MNVLAVTPGPRRIAPGERYRIEQWEPHLQREGIVLTYRPFLSPSLGNLLYRRGHTLRKAAGVLAAHVGRLATIVEAPRFDLVYLFREAALIGPAVIERALALRGVPILYDFDDAVFLRYRSPGNPFWGRLKYPGKTATLCRKARLVMAGNAYLAEYASRYNDDVTVIPTTIDTELYRPEQRHRGASDVVTLGWTGSHSTAQHLRRLVPALTALAKKRRFRLVVVGAEPPEIPGIDVIPRAWRAETEVEDLSDIDIGLMPLPDEPWARGKCGLKALQYLALGIPAVVSPVGVNPEIVTDGESGFLARTDEEWVERLTALLDDATLRKRMGEKGRLTVETRYAARVVAPKVAALFRRAAR